ncbi:MAG TPA: transporter substrate-binding domain-containing protein [Burkholderiaceae bacterium]|nr:transporter substrate-binding domain-containing protein [Burkholderiaceae bacterium]
MFFKLGRAGISALILLAGSGNAHADVSRLDSIIESGKLRVCTTGDYPPFSHQITGANFEGMDIDLAMSLSKALGVEAQFVKTSWPTLMDDFSAHCDIAMGGISVTLERLKKAAFSEAHMIDGKAAIARCADVQKYQTLAEIDQPSTRAIVNPGGTNERFAHSVLKHAQLIAYPDNVTIFQQLVDGKADIMLTDASETLWQAKQHHELCAIHPEQPFQYAEKAYLLPRGDVTFKAWVDAWMRLQKANGEYQRVFDKWLK